MGTDVVGLPRDIAAIRSISAHLGKWPLIHVIEDAALDFCLGVSVILLPFLARAAARGIPKPCNNHRRDDDYREEYDPWR